MFRKTPLAWLQVTRERTRLLVAVAGIAFADILMFVQLGFKDALYASSMRVNLSLQADLVLINPKLETLIATQSFPRERLFQTLRFDGVESVSSLYIGIGEWRNPENRSSRNILIFGTEPGKPGFNLPEVQQNQEKIKLLGNVLFDRGSRPEYGAIAATFQEEPPLITEVNNHKIEVSGLFSLGASFAADGNLIVSDSTFLYLFRSHKPEDIEVGLINLKSGINPEQMQAVIKASLPNDVLVLTLTEFAEIERSYWANSTPIGFIFGLGVIVGFIVGIVIVYQILYSDVSDHLPEYATLKAMGYTNGYLLSVLFQEALMLAVLGYIPGFLLSVGLYYLAYSATLLPIAMTVNRAVLVMILTTIMCSFSGLLSMQKLQSADPADIF